MGLGLFGSIKVAPGVRLGASKRITAGGVTGLFFSLLGAAIGGVVGCELTGAIWPAWVAAVVAGFMMLGTFPRLTVALAILVGIGWLVG